MASITKTKTKDSSSSSILDIYPASLVFRVGGDRSKHVLPVTVTNLNTQSTAAFKFKTNAPQRYTVKPVMGTIPPGGTVSVNIRLDANFQPSNDTRFDKFLVQTYLVPDAQVELFSADSWRDIDKSQISQIVVNTRVLVVGEVNGNSSSSAASVRRASASSTSTSQAPAESKSASNIVTKEPSSIEETQQYIAKLDQEARVLRASLATLEAQASKRVGNRQTFVPTKAHVVIFSLFFVLFGLFLSPSLFAAN